MEKKYNLSKRIIQRKFAQIEQDNFNLYRIYRNKSNRKNKRKR